MISFTANFAAQAFANFKVPAHNNTFEQDENGTWYIVHGVEKEYVLESDVIDSCRRALNWREIRAKYFPMVGFHN